MYIGKSIGTALKRAKITFKRPHAYVYLGYNISTLSVFKNTYNQVTAHTTYYGTLHTYSIS